MLLGTGLCSTLPEGTATRVTSHWRLLSRIGQATGAMNAFIKTIKDLCDARSFRGLKDERERFSDYVKAQCDCI